MDASRLKGLGGIFEDKWFSSRYPCHFRSRDIQFKEIYVMMQAILRWGHCWEGCHVTFHIDNMAIISVISSGTIQNAQVMNVLRSIDMLAVWLGFAYSSFWVLSIHNLLADAASCFEYAWLFQITPTMKKKGCLLLPQLRGIKCMLTYLHRWPSCGMASLP